MGRNKKDVSAMSAGEINRELDNLELISSNITDDMILAGRGRELPSETIKKSDPLSIRMKKYFDEYNALRGEVLRRYGPGAPQRLPSRQGFGPIKSIKNPRSTIIYDEVLYIVARKGQNHKCDAECRKCDHTYKHDFTSKALIIGNPDGSLTIRPAK